MPEKTHPRIEPRTQNHETGAHDDSVFLDPRKIRVLEKRRRSEAEVYALSEVFGILSDVTRLKIVLALGEAELCVGDLAGFLSLSPSAVSHHLRLMRQLRLVKFRRDGKMTYYTLDDDHITTLLRQATEHIREGR